jgi:hypothetical protein
MCIDVDIIEILTKSDHHSFVFVGEWVYSELTVFVPQEPD